MTEWNDFFVATSGASAALIGLIFVGVTVNLSKFQEDLTKMTQIFQSIVSLLVILIVSVLNLVPKINSALVGVSLIIIGVLAFIVSVNNPKEKSSRKYPFLVVLLNQILIYPYIIAGVITLCEGASGFYWLVAAIILSFIRATMTAWMLLLGDNIRRGPDKDSSKSYEKTGPIK